LAPLLSGNDLTCIEINEQTLSLAQQNFPDIRMELGDVRTWVGEYDVILDFSTIDHFPDFDAAIENYKKLAPKLHCVVWLGGHSPQGDQYWHPHNEFRQSMSRYANVEETLLYADGSKHLVYFLAHDLPL
jgi:trans-aconitate methyltransferase